jgi:hypothetical protein
MGLQVGTAYRTGLELTLIKEEIDSYMTKTVLPMKTAEDFESKLGNVIYTLIFYDKQKRVNSAPKALRFFCPYGVI